MDWNRENAKSIIQKMVSDSNTSGKKAGKIKGTNKLSTEQLTQLLDTIIQCWFDPKTTELEKMFYVFDDLMKKVRKFKNMGYPLSSEFEHDLVRFGLDSFKGKNIETIETGMKIGRQLWTYVTSVLEVSGIRNIWQADKEFWFKKIKTARIDLDMFGITLEQVEELVSVRQVEEIERCPAAYGLKPGEVLYRDQPRIDPL